MNLLQMRTRVAEFLEDSAFSQWSAALVDQYLNDAAQDFAKATKCIRKYSSPLSANTTFETLGTGNVTINDFDVTNLSAPTRWRLGQLIYGTGIPDGTTVTAINGTTLTMSAKGTATNTGVTLTDKAYAFYTVPSDLHELESVWVNGYRVPIASATSLPYQWDRQTAGAASQPTAYVFGDFGFTVVRFWPYPVLAYTTVYVYYTALPATMTLTTSTPAGIPDQYHLALVYYAVAQCYKRNFEDNDRPKAAEFEGMYRAQLDDCLARVTRLLNADPNAVPYRHL